MQKLKFSHKAITSIPHFLFSHEGAYSQLQDLLGEAIDNGETQYMYSHQNEESHKMSQQLEIYKKKLSQWATDAKQQLYIQFGEDIIQLRQKAYSQAEEEIETIVSKQSQFNKDLFTLDNNDPYIRVLAVFFND